MSNKNPFGVLHRGPQEWGAQSRQDEDKARGMRRKGRDQSIAEQLADVNEADADWAAFEDQWP